jgi:hypothetical protein
MTRVRECLARQPKPNWMLSAAMLPLLMQSPKAIELIRHTCIAAPPEMQPDP